MHTAQPSISKQCQAIVTDTVRVLSTLLYIYHGFNCKREQYAIHGNPVAAHEARVILSDAWSLKSSSDVLWDLMPGNSDPLLSTYNRKIQTKICPVYDCL